MNNLKSAWNVFFELIFYEIVSKLIFVSIILSWENKVRAKRDLSKLRSNLASLKPCFAWTSLRSKLASFEPRFARTLLGCSTQNYWNKNCLDNTRYTYSFLASLEPCSLNSKLLKQKLVSIIFCKKINWKKIFQALSKLFNVTKIREKTFQNSFFSSEEFSKSSWLCTPIGALLSVFKLHNFFSPMNWSR